MPTSEKQVPVTSPTYPVPTIAIFIKIILPLSNSPQRGEGLFLNLLTTSPKIEDDRRKFYFINSNKLSVMYFNVSSSISVCIGNDKTVAHNFSVIGKSPFL